MTKPPTDRQARLAEHARELAERTWPGAGPLTVETYDFGGVSSHADVRSRHGVLLEVDAPNGRALEALYAALSALAPEKDYGDP